MADIAAAIPETIDRLSSGCYSALAMLAGMQLDLFTPLAVGPMSAGQVADSIGVGVAKLEPLLFVLVVAGLLTVEDGRFSNTAEANRFLVQGKPQYVGGRHVMLAERWSAMLKTADSVRTGSAQSKVDFATISPQAVEASAASRHSETVAAGRDLVARYDFSGYRRLVDVGGRTGGLAFAALEAHPQLKGKVVDLPATAPLTQRYIEESGLGDRLQVVAVDVVDRPIDGCFDVAVMRNFIQVLSPHQARRALGNVARIIEPGGDLYILGSILDDTRLSPPEAVASNLNFINIYDGGQAFTEGDYRDWLTEAGFEDCERTLLPNGTSIITARKPKE